MGQDQKSWKRDGGRGRKEEEGGGGGEEGAEAF